MQELRQYIREQLYKVRVAPTRYHISGFILNEGMAPMIEAAADYFNNDFTDDVISRIYDEEEFDPVIENLNTHDVSLLKKKLLQYFSDSIYKIDDYQNSKEDKKYSIGVWTKDNNLSKDEKFIHLIEFYGYKISQVDGDWIGIIVVYTESAKSIVEKNHYRFYHFTKKENVNHILKNGLQIRKGSYREFPARVHLYAEYRPISQIRDEVEKFAKKVTNKWNLDDIAILKIDLHDKYERISFYKDDAMSDYGRAVYCYHNIVPKYIEEVKWK